jgi:DNA polymerase-3 subunit alpha
MDITEISKAIRDCSICPQVELCHVVGSIVSLNDEKDPTDLIFVGEAPGEVEAEKGIPFCGPSGQFLREALSIINEGNYTLLNVLKCRPPNNRDPSFVEMKNCYPFLRDQITILQPELKKVVALGKIADEALKALKIRHVTLNHPSWALRKEMKAKEYAVEISRILYEEKEKEIITDLFPAFHNHSHFSVGDSVRSPEEIIDFCKAGEMPIVALTDHGTLAGIYDFEDAAIKAEIPHIIGYEAYVSLKENNEMSLTCSLKKAKDSSWKLSISCPSFTHDINLVNYIKDMPLEKEVLMALLEPSLNDIISRFVNKSKSKKFDSIRGKEFVAQWGNGKVESGHMNIWVISPEGWQNLLYLHNEGARKSTTRKVVISLDSLKEHARGLIFGSACIGGLLAQQLLHLGEEAALEWLRDLANVLRAQDSTIMLEVMPHLEVRIPPKEGRNGLSQAELNRFLIYAGRKLSLNVIATTDSHYNRPEDKEIKMQAMAMAYHDRSIINPDSDYFLGNSYYFMSRSEIIKALSIGEEAIGIKPEEVGNIIHVSYLFTSKMAMLTQDFKLPRIFAPMNIDPGIDFEFEIWESWNFLKMTKFDNPDIIQIYEDRLRLEVDRIKRKGFGWYFKIMKRFSDRLIERGIPVGPGRGSAGGSLIAYVLGITHIDPIEHNLLFDRFMSEERNDPPDIDLDVATSRRAEAIDILSEIMGFHDIANIMDYGRWKKDMAARDVCWLLEEDQYEFEHNGAGTEVIQPIINNIVDHIRYRGTHASGFVGFDNLDSLFPLAKLAANREIPSIEFELNTLNRLGIAKFDILGLTELDNIYMMEDLETHKPILDMASYQGDYVESPILQRMIDEGLWDNYEFKVNKLPPEEIKRLLELACRYPVGLFQIKTSAGNNTMNELKPSTFEELIHVLAINRPGPRESGMVDLYKKRKFDKEPYVPLISTSETYGCPIFQEQILVILNKVFGMSLGQADEVRRYISKKKLEKLQEVEEGLVEYLSDPERKVIWDQVMNWAAYGFNRSHATAYAVLSIMTIWAKDRMPATFYAHVLNLETDKVKRRAALREARDIGISILRPNINFSHGNDFVTYQTSIALEDKKKIILGFNTVKGLAEKTSMKIAEKLSEEKELTDRQVSLLERAGFSGPSDQPFLSSSLPLDSVEVVPWHTYNFNQASILDMAPGDSGQMTLILYEGLDHIVRVEDNSGAFRLYSQGIPITKEDLKVGILNGLIFKGQNDKIYLIEKEGYSNPERPTNPTPAGFRVVYATKPINSKAGNWYILALMKTPLRDNSEVRIIESIIMAPEEYLKKIRRGAILVGNYGNGFFRWEYEKQLGEIKK